MLMLNIVQIHQTDLEKTIKTWLIVTLEYLKTNLS